MKKVFLILLLMIGASAFSQQKIALFIGNGDYTGISKLRNPENDANDMAAVLRGLGFTVEKVLNGSLDQMETAAMNLGRKLSAGHDAYGFFFYAGHGVQSGGDNYLIPVDAGNILSENHLRQRAFSVQTLLDNLNDARNELNIVVLDACRDNPFGWARSGSRGLAMFSSAPAGSIIMYATSANSTADDGTGQNGLFTAQLLRNLGTPGLSVRDIFDKTGEDVVRISNGRQHPELSVRYFGASTAYLGLKSAAPLLNASAIPVDLLGRWLYSDTSISFSSSSFSVSWPASGGGSSGYTVSGITCTAVTNTSGRNENFRSGYRITGSVVTSDIPSVTVGDLIDRTYFLDAGGNSFWNSGSSTYVIYRKQ